jgi:hypothetical protein
MNYETKDEHLIVWKSIFQQKDSTGFAKKPHIFVTGG